MKTSKKQITEQVRQKYLRQHKAECERLRSYSATLRAVVREHERTEDALRTKCEELQDTINQLNDWVERLLEFTELSKEDIQTCIARDKKISSLISSMLTNTNFARIDDMFEQ